MRILSIPLPTLVWLAAAGAFTIGTAWQDCVLIASSAMLSMHGFELHMEAGAPWAGWRAAIRSWSMGVAALAFGLALWVMVGSVQLEWWTPANDHPVEALWVGGATLTACWATRFGLQGSGFRMLASLIGPAGVLAALTLGIFGWNAAPCFFAAVAAAEVGYVDWCRARSAGDLWAADHRR